jgi:hypothetical protein
MERFILVQSPISATPPTGEITNLLASNTSDLMYDVYAQAVSTRTKLFRLGV